MRVLPIAVLLLTLPVAAQALQPEVLWKEEFPDCPGSGFVHLVPIEGKDNAALLVVRTPGRWSLYEVRASRVTHLVDVSLGTPRSTAVEGAAYLPDRGELLIAAVVGEEEAGPAGCALAVSVRRGGTDVQRFDGPYIAARPCPDGTILALLRERHEFLEDKGVHRYTLTLTRLHPDGRAERLVTFEVLSTLPPGTLSIPGTLRIEPFGDGYLITGSGLVGLVELRRTASGWEPDYIIPPDNFGRERPVQYFQNSVVLDPSERLILARVAEIANPEIGHWVVCRPSPQGGVPEELRRVNLGEILSFLQTGVRLRVDGTAYRVVPAIGPSSAELLILGPGTIQVWEVPGFQELAVTPRLYGVRVSENEAGGCTVEVCAFKPSRSEEWLAPLFGGAGKGTGERRVRGKESRMGEGGKSGGVMVVPAVPPRRPQRS